MQADESFVIQLNWHGAAALAFNVAVIAVLMWHSGWMRGFNRCKRIFVKDSAAVPAPGGEGEA